MFSRICLIAALGLVLSQVPELAEAAVTGNQQLLAAAIGLLTGLYIVGGAKK